MRNREHCNRNKHVFSDFVSRLSVIKGRLNKPEERSIEISQDEREKKKMCNTVPPKKGEKCEAFTKDLHIMELPGEEYREKIT